MRQYVYVIMVEFMVDGKVNETYVSGEGYDKLQKALDFLVNERKCKLYESFSEFPYKENKDGWYGIPQDDDKHRYYIREISIK